MRDAAMRQTAFGATYGAAAGPPCDVGASRRRQEADGRAAGVRADP